MLEGISIIANSCFFEDEIIPEIRRLVRKEFEKGAGIPVVYFPKDSAEVQDSPRLTLIVMDPQAEWSGSGPLRQQIGEWTKQHGKSPRLYPGALIWCVRKQGRDLKDKVELLLAWQKVAGEIALGTLGADFDKSDRSDIQAKVKGAEEDARDEVWGGYRFVIIADGERAGA